MEPIGFTVGLGSLFNTCIDLMDKIDSYKDYGVESRSIMALFEADKILFQKWARSVGIHQGNLKDVQNVDLENPELACTVEKILTSICEVFGKAESVMSRQEHVSHAGPKPSQENALFSQGSIPNQHLTVSRRKRAGWALTGKAKFIEQVERFGDLVQRLVTLVPPNTVKQATDAKSARGLDEDFVLDAKWFSDARRALTEMSKQFKADTRREIDSWLSATWTNDLKDKFLRRRLDGTCNWILSCLAFKEWISSEFPSNTAKILWVNSPAGCGKTIICASVIQHLLTVGGSPLAYFFFSSESENRGDPFVIIRSWISQVVAYDENAYEIARERWQMREGHTASRTDILELFREIVRNTPNCIFVVDGLDECVGLKDRAADDNSPMGFISSLKQAIAQTTSRIMIVSRDEVGIRSGIHFTPANDPKQTVYTHTISKDDVQPDIEQFCKTIVDRKLANKSETLKVKLSQRMVERCNGMFLWIKMLEDNLRGGKSTKKLEEIVDQAPTGLERLYDRNWEIISNHSPYDSVRAFSILRWVTFALRPLTVSELTEALLVEEDDSYDDLPVDQIPEGIDDVYVNEEIVNLCGSLVEIQGTENLGSSTVHLTHFSIKQYILCKMYKPGLSDMNRLLRPTEMIPSNELAKICLRYLNFGKVWQQPELSKDILNSRPFRNYAARFWHHHIIRDSKSYAEVVELINILFHPSNPNWSSLKIWFDCIEPLSNLPKIAKVSSSSPLYYASLLKLHHTVMYLTEELNLDVNNVDEHQRTALHAACSQGCFKIVKVLLEKGANVKATNDEGLTPLYMASSEGYVEIVELLLESEADVMAKNSKGLTPLYIASREGHLDVAKVLLQNGADAMATSTDGWTLLHVASVNNHVEIAKMLIEAGADKTAVTNDGSTPLLLASYNGHIEMVNMLLETGANMTVAVADKEGKTPLHYASRYGHIEVINALFQKGAKATVTDKNGWTLLHVASFNNHVEIAKMLMEAGADKTAVTNDGSTPLLLASYKGHIEMVNMLLDMGANMTVAVADKEGKTPLHYASCYGHIEIINALFQKGAKATVTDNDGWTPLHCACRNGHLEAAKVLLENGSDIMAVRNDAFTPLHSACCDGYVEIVKMLLENGALAMSISDCGWTPLHIASCYGHVELAGILLEKGANIPIALPDGYTSLHLASCNGHVKVVKMLLESGADVAAVDNNGCTSLQMASGNGHIHIIELLLENGADIKAADMNGCTSLQAASSNGYIDVAKLLLEKGAEFDSQGRGLQNLLQIAASRENQYLMQLLIEKAKNANIQADIFRDVLHTACIHGHITIVEQLIRLGVSLNKADEHGWNPLLCASWFGQTQVLDYLLSNGGDRDLLSTVNNTSPSSWSTIEKSTKLGLDEDLRCVRYSNTDDIENREVSAALILANHPIPLQANGYYYEIEILNSGDTGEIALGLCSRYTPLDSLPGWNSTSWGYHGDDAKTYFKDTGTSYGTTFNVGDIIGCHVRLNDSVSFTLNGVSLGVAFHGISGKLYPVVGMKSPGAHIRANFGQEAFMYKII